MLCVVGWTGGSPVLGQVRQNNEKCAQTGSKWLADGMVPCDGTAGFAESIQISLVLPSRQTTYDAKNKEGNVCSGQMACTRCRVDSSPSAQQASSFSPFLSGLVQAVKTLLFFVSANRGGEKVQHRRTYQNPSHSAQAPGDSFKAMQSTRARDRVTSQFSPCRLCSRNASRMTRSAMGKRTAHQPRAG